MLAVAAVALSCGLFAPGAHQVVAAATAPPSPPPLGGPTLPPLGPSSNASPGQATVPLNRATPVPSGSPSAPPDDGRKGLEGVWEVVIQRMNDDPLYDHIKLTQKENVLTGVFLDNQNHNKQYPLAGSVDGNNIHLVVTKDDGTTMTFNGTVDGTTDMIGMMQRGTETIAFTAAYRPKYKFIDSIAPGTGMPGTGGTGGGSYPGGPP